MTVRFSIEEKLEAVEIAITAFRWARSEPTSRAGKVYEILKEVAGELREHLPPDERQRVVVRS